MRLRIWSAKGGVEAPISWRTSSTVGWRWVRSTRSYSLIRPRRLLRWLVDRHQRDQRVELRLHVSRDRVRAAEDPDAVEDAVARVGVGVVARLDVEEEALQVLRQRRGRVGEQQWGEDAVGAEAGGAGGVAGALRVRDGVVAARRDRAPAEVALVVAGERHRVGLRAVGADALDLAELAELLLDVRRDHRVRPEDEDARLLVLFECGLRLRGDLVLLDEQDRVARARAPGRGRHRVLRLLARRDDHVRRRLAARDAREAVDGDRGVVRVAALDHGALRVRGRRRLVADQDRLGAAR